MNSQKTMANELKIIARFLENALFLQNFVPLDLAFMKFFVIQSIAPLFEQKLEVLVQINKEYVFNVYGPFEIWHDRGSNGSKIGIGRTLNEAIVNALKQRFS